MFPFEPLEVYTLFDSVLPTSTGIYAIVNVTNGKYYIGSSSHVSKRYPKCQSGFRSRFYKHRSKLKKGVHDSPQLQNSYNKCIREGKDPNSKFQIWILEYVDESLCLQVEQEYLDTYEFFYNTAKDATSPMKGRSPSPEARRKQSENSKSPLICAKDYVAISPLGEVIEFTNINKFVRENPDLGFNQANISACATGRRRHCWNWRFFYREDYLSMNGILPPLEYAELGKNYVAISPSGEHIEFINARQFCRDYPEWNFSYKNISACTKGEKKSHKGWQFFHKEDYQAKKGNIPNLSKKSYIGISPDGLVVSFTNAAAFAKDNPDWKFHARHISSCVRGLLKTHRSWKFYYAEDYYKSAA